MPTAVLGGLRQCAERKESSFVCQHCGELALQPLLSLVASGVCLMQDEGQKTSVEKTLAGLPCCLQSTLNAADSWKLTVF